MHRIGRDPQVPPQQPAEPRGVEDRARPDHAPRRQARNGLRDLAHDVDGVRRDQQHRVGADRHDLAHHGAEHLRVPLQKRQARLAGFLRHPAGEDHHPRARDIRIAPWRTMAGAAKGTAWAISSASARARASSISTKDQFLRDPLQDQREARRRADHPGPDDCDFHVRLHVRRPQVDHSFVTRPRPSPAPCAATRARLALRRQRHETPMILGILQTGRVSDEASALYGGYLDMFARLFEPRGFELRLWQVVDGDFPEGPEAADAWLITGSPHGVYETALDRPARGADPRHPGCGPPLVGICFGHQIVAHGLRRAGREVPRRLGAWAASLRHRGDAACDERRPPGPGHRNRPRARNDSAATTSRSTRCSPMAITS
jgi:hypothetical protein